MEWSSEQSPSLSLITDSKLWGFLKSNFSNRELNPLNSVLGTKLMESTEKLPW